MEGSYNMRGNSIAVRIPRIVYQTTANEMLIRAKSPNIERLTPKEIMRQSREYVRALTPASPTIYSLSPSQYRTSPKETKEKISFKQLKIHRKSEDRQTFKLRLLPNQSSPLNKNSKSVTKTHNHFDLFILEKEINSNIENELFPKEMNEKIQYLPQLSPFEHLDWGEPLKEKAKKRICQKSRGYWLNSPSNWSNRIEDSFIKKSKIENIVEKPCFRFPRFASNKTVNRSVPL